MTAPLPTETQHHARVARAARALADATRKADDAREDGRDVPGPVLRYLLKSSREVLAALAADYRPDTAADLERAAATDAMLARLEEPA